MLALMAYATVVAMNPDDTYARLMENMPPDAPASNEVQITTLVDPNVKVCVKSAESIIQKVDATVVRVVITRSPRYGEVWRADSATHDHPPILFRHVCSKAGSLVRPLEMFDPKQSISPLR
jgi:hypothetical protein